MNDSSVNILVLDIETAPNLAYVWKLWDTNVGLDMLIDEHYMLCWAAKWVGDDKVYSSSLGDETKKKMLTNLHKMLDKADVVMTYNGVRFDIPHINREFLLMGMAPPSPYKQMDLLKTVKRQFKFASNKLDHVAQSLGLKGKIKHSGFSLWVGCIKGDADSWRAMLEYNKQDVVLLEEVYEKLQPWVVQHPNMSVLGLDKGEVVCPKCGSNHSHKRGLYTAVSSTYQRYQCQSCGGWFKDGIIRNRNKNKTVNI